MSALLFVFPLIIIAVVVIAKWALLTHDMMEAAKFAGQRKGWGTGPVDSTPHSVIEKIGREERENASGIVIDPSGTCLCCRCGRTVSALYDHCLNCNSKINWDA